MIDIWRLPGDPIILFLGERVSKQRLTEEARLWSWALGLSCEVANQVLNWLLGTLLLHLGHSLFYYHLFCDGLELMLLWNEVHLLLRIRLALHIG